MRLVRQIRFRNEGDYEAFVDRCIPCADCGRLDLPQILNGCECGEHRCTDCHEKRLCCGEGAPKPCPRCGDVPTVELNFAWVVRCACWEDTPGQPVGGAMRRWEAIGNWNDAVDDLEALP